MSLFRAGICCKFGLLYENLPVAVPPNPLSLLIWFMFACILPLCWCLNIVSINVALALFVSLAWTIFCARGCLCVTKKFLSNFGCFVMPVLSYDMLNLSNAFATLTADHTSTLIPVSFFISCNMLFSFFTKFFSIFFAFSKSTRTPFHVISNKQGKSRVSRSKILDNFCFISSGLNTCHNFNVKSASCSAYGPTCIAGSLYISDFASTPHSLAASYNPASDFVSCK